MYLKAVHPLFVWAARSRQPKPENKTRVKGFLGGMQSKKGNLQKKQWLSSSNSLPCSFTYFAWWQMKGLCASLALFWFLCHSNGKEGESAESPVCLHTLNTNITSLFIKHVGPQSCPALVRLVLLNSQGRGVQKGRCHCVWTIISLAIPRIDSSQYLHRNVLHAITPLNWLLNQTWHNEAVSCLNMTDSPWTAVDRFPTVNGPRNEMAKDHISLHCVCWAKAVDHLLPRWKINSQSPSKDVNWCTCVVNPLDKCFHSG